MYSKKKNNSIADIYKEVGPYIGLGTQLALTLVIMLLLGRYLDDEFETEPILTVVCLFIGAFAGIYNFIKTVLDLNDKKKNN